MSKTSVRTILEHPDFARIVADIKLQAQEYQVKLGMNPKTMLIAAQAARTFHRKAFRRLGLTGMYCSRQAHSPMVDMHSEVIHL